MATNNPIVIDVNDREGGRVFFFIVQPPQHGLLYYFNRDETLGVVTTNNFQVLDTFAPNEDPHLFYVPDPDYNTDGALPDSFTFRIFDEQLLEWRCQPTVNLYVTGVPN